MNRHGTKSRTGENLIKGKINSVLKVGKEKKRWSRTGASPTNKRSKSRSKKFAIRADHEESEISRAKAHRTQTETSSRRKYGSNKLPPMLKSGNQSSTRPNDSESQSQFEMSIKSKRKDSRRGKDDFQSRDIQSKTFMSSKSRGRNKRSRNSNPQSMTNLKKTTLSKTGDLGGLRVEELNKRERDYKSRNTLNEKQWESTPRDNQPHSMGKRRRGGAKNSSIQSAKFMKSKRVEVASYRQGYQSRIEDRDLSVFWMLRVKDEVKVSHINTCNHLKNWFGKIFINGNNSQEKFFGNFKKYLREDENIYFLCFGLGKSGKTFSIQGILF